MSPLAMLKNLMVAVFCAGIASADSFSGFTPGNLILSRTVYTGDANTITVGQALPPICPATAKCGTAVASDNGAYPNVFNNDKLDGSFGITSPILLDQITTTGTLVNTLAVPTNLLVTSFSSKSEMAVNLSTDGTAITLMGYIAPPNTIDVSNGNTPVVYDPTNPAGGSYFRGVLQVGANGAMRITPTNAYPGNNGRAAILANGLYYLTGNSNNGSGTPADVVAAGGVQVATPGQPASTAPTQVGSFSITQLTDPTTGKPFAADKLGKDNNYRGLTIFNNTVYVTKGSGSNGVNTVYQVGTAGTLPTLATAVSAPINVLPGFPTALARAADATFNFPFGVWFANATTLYVADEGDGVAADAATSKNAGLQKWSLVNGTWQLNYVLQKGLNLGQQYSITGYPTSLNPATDGLRNLTGRVNTDGTVTIWAVTSTVSANGDQGADPNQLVTITDVLANTTAAGAASEQFAILRTAMAGEVFRGISLTPKAGATAMVNTPFIGSSANPGAVAIAPGSLATVNGINLANATSGSTSLPLPLTFSGNSVSIQDAGGKSFSAPLLYVSPSQINFEVPAGLATGTATVTVTSGDGTKSVANVQIAPVAPGIFTLNNAALAAAVAIRVASNGQQTAQDVYTFSNTGAIVANPISMGSATDTVYLSLFGTGLQAAGNANTSVSVNGVNTTVTYSGPGGGFAGLDQVNVRLPASVAGKGNVNVQLTANGVAANPVQITIQ